MDKKTEKTGPEPQKGPKINMKFEFDEKNLKDEDNKEVSKQSKDKKKKEDDDLVDRMLGLADGLF